MNMFILLDENCVMNNNNNNYSSKENEKPIVHSTHRNNTPQHPFIHSFLKACDQNEKKLHWRSLSPSQKKARANK
jgi:hypothetical protein